MHVCFRDAGIHDACVMMHISMIIDHDACVYDAHICINDPRPLTLMHVCMMHISMILDPNEYLHGTCIHDANIYDL